MKIAVIYSGSYNTLEIAHTNHKEFIFDFFDKHDIDYDVFCNLSPEFYIKHPDKKLLIDVINFISEQFNNFNFYKEYGNLISEEYLQKESALTYWHIINFKMDENYIKTNIENLFKNNLKYLNIDRYLGPINDKNIKDLYLHENYFASISYEKIKTINNFMEVNNLNYDKYIVLRPELLFNNYIDMNYLLKSKEFIINGSGRLDFYQISNIFLPKIINEDLIRKIDKIVKERDKIKYPSFETLFTSHIKDILNIDLQLSYIGHKIEAEIFNEITILLKEYGVCSLTFEEFKKK